MLDPATPSRSPEEEQADRLGSPSELAKAWKVVPYWFVLSTGSILSVNQLVENCRETKKENASQFFSPALFTVELYHPVAADSYRAPEE